MTTVRTPGVRGENETKTDSISDPEREIERELGNEPVCGWTGDSTASANGDEESESEADRNAASPLSGGLAFREECFCAAARSRTLTNPGPKVPSYGALEGSLSKSESKFNGSTERALFDKPRHFKSVSDTPSERTHVHRIAVALCTRSMDNLLCAQRACDQCEPIDSAENVS